MPSQAAAGAALWPNPGCAALKRPQPVSRFAPPSLQLPQRRTLLRLLAAGALGSGPGAHAEEGLLRRPWPRGRKLPALDLPGLDGHPGWRPADTRGRVTLLNFWASWCEPCRAEMPSLQQLAEQRADEGLSVVAVNFRDSEATIRRFLAANPLRLPLLRDVDGATAKGLGVSIFPSTLALARDGRPAFVLVGATDWSTDPARGWITELLRARPA